jgi:hypothetical protein
MEGRLEGLKLVMRRVKFEYRCRWIRVFVLSRWVALR